MTPTLKDTSRGTWTELAHLPLPFVVAVRRWLTENPTKSVSDKVFFEVQVQTELRNEERPLVDDCALKEILGGGKTAVFCRAEFKTTRNSRDLESIIRSATAKLLRSPSAEDQPYLLLTVSVDAYMRVAQTKLRTAVEQSCNALGCALTLRERRKLTKASNLGPVFWFHWLLPHGQSLELVVADSRRLPEALAVAAFGAHGDPRAIRALGSICYRLFRDPERLVDVLTSLRTSPPRLDFTPGALPTWFRTDLATLTHFLTSPREAIRADYATLSLHRQPGPHRWTRTLIHLLNGLIFPDWSQSDGFGEDRIERFLDPMPFRTLGSADPAARSLMIAASYERRASINRLILEAPPGAGKSSMLGYRKWLASLTLYSNVDSLAVTPVCLLIDFQKYGADVIDWYNNQEATEHNETVARESLLRLLRVCDLDQARRIASNGESLFNPANGSLADEAFTFLLNDRGFDLLLDGYDHVAFHRNGQAAVSALVQSIDKYLGRPVATLVASRPGFGADAIWNFDREADKDARKEAATVVLAPPMQRDIVLLVRGWQEMLAYFRKPQLESRLLDWLTGKRDVAETDASRFAEVVTKNPLLTTVTLALAYAPQRQSWGSPSSEWLPACEAELLDALEKQHQMAASRKDIARKVGSGQSKRVVLAPYVHQIAYVSLMDPTCVLGEVALDAQAWFNGEECAVRNMLSLEEASASPYLVFQRAEVYAKEAGTAEGQGKPPQSARFLHPVLQEFMACAYFVDNLTICYEAPQQIEIMSANNQRTPALKRMSTVGFERTELAAVLTRLGNHSLKYILGRLLTLSPRDRVPNRTSTAGQPELLIQFLEALATEVTLQQYFYDVQYLRNATRELEMLEKELRQHPRGSGVHLALIFTVKCLGHMEYGVGTPEAVERSRAYLNDLIELCAGSGEPLETWYKMFAHDHIQNRLPPDSEEREKHIQGFLDLSRNAGDIAALDLRRAHFFGHMGNQIGRFIDQSERAHIGEQEFLQACSKGIFYYSEAARFRVRVFMTSLQTAADGGSGREQHLHGLASRLESLVAAFLSRCKQEVAEDLSPYKAQEGAVRQRALTSIGEAFFGPSQGLGDTAHQMAQCACIKLWLALAATLGGDKDKAQRICWDARLDYMGARRLWRYAWHAREIAGERVIKYCASMAGLEFRIKAADAMISGADVNVDWNAEGSGAHRRNWYIQEFDLALPVDDSSAGGGADAVEFAKACSDIIKQR